MRRLGFTLSLLVLLSPAFALAEDDAPTRIQLERARAEQLGATLSASGSVRARRVTPIGSEVGGRIIEVHVDVGDIVAEGDALFQIDPEPYRMALAEAQAGLALAKAESDNAAAEAARIAKLVELSAASEQRHDKLRTQAEVARARVAQLRAGLDRTRRELARATVVAPYAANVVERAAHEGSMSTGEPVIVLQERGILEFVVNVPEASSAPVRKGDPVRLFVEGVADPIETRVERVNARVDSETRTYQVRGLVPDPAGELKAGSYLRAELRVSRDEARPAVHRSAVLTRDGRTFVMRVADGVVSRTPVRVGIRGGERVEILQGLEAGDLVVRGPGASRIADGTRVRVKQPLQAAQAEDAP